MTDSFRRFWDLGFHRLTPIIPPDAEISERSTLYKRIGTSLDGRVHTAATSPGLTPRSGASS